MKYSNYNIFKLPAATMAILCSSCLILFYVPTFFTVLNVYLWDSFFNIEILNLFKIQQNFMSPYLNFWIIWYPIICIIFITSWGFLHQVIFRFDSKLLLSIFILTNSVLSIIFHYSFIFSPNFPIETLFLLLIFVTIISMFVNVYFWLKKLYSINFTATVPLIFSSGCLFYYFIGLLIFIYFSVLQLEYSIDLVSIVLLLFLIGSSFITVSVIYQWLFVIDKSTILGVLSRIHFVFFIIGSFVVFYSIAYKFFGVNFLKYIILLHQIYLTLSIIIFFVILLYSCINSQKLSFFKWLANCYLLFVNGFHSAQLPQTFIQDSLIIGAIVTRIIVWSFVFNFRIRIVLIFFLPLLFLAAAYILLLILYRYIYVYFRISSKARSFIAFLSKYGETELVEEFFVNFFLTNKI